MIAPRADTLPSSLLTPPRVFVNYTVIFAGIDPDTKEEYSVECACCSSAAAARRHSSFAERDLCASRLAHRPCSADDCNGEGLFNNYCVHILARKPTMSAALMDKLVKASLALNLNTQNLPFNQTMQAGCW